jgi:hypothetical protein
MLSPHSCISQVVTNLRLILPSKIIDDPLEIIGFIGEKIGPGCLARRASVTRVFGDAGDGFGRGENAAGHDDFDHVIGVFVLG